MHPKNDTLKAILYIIGVIAVIAVAVFFHLNVQPKLDQKWKDKVERSKQYREGDRLLLVTRGVAASGFSGIIDHDLVDNAVGYTTREFQPVSISCPDFLEATVYDTLNSGMYYNKINYLSDWRPFSSFRFQITAGINAPTGGPYSVDFTFRKYTHSIEVRVR